LRIVPPFDSRYNKIARLYEKLQLPFIIHTLTTARSTEDVALFVVNNNRQSNIFMLFRFGGYLVIPLRYCKFTAECVMTFLPWGINIYPPLYHFLSVQL